MLRDSSIAAVSGEQKLCVLCNAYITACPWAFAPRCLTPKESHTLIRTRAHQSRNVNSRCAAGCVSRVDQFPSCNLSSLEAICNEIIQG